MVQHKVLKHKAAGHEGTLTDADELLVFKPATPQELEFYRAIQEKTFNGTGTTDGDVPLYSWMPTFLGVLDEGLREVPESAYALENTDVNLNDVVVTKGPSKFRYVVMENLLHGFHKPNIIDVKLGRVLYDENASTEKMSRLGQVSRTTTSGPLGFRICGMKIQCNSQAAECLEPNHFESTGDGYILVNKEFGYSLKKHNVKDALNLFFSHDELSPRRILQLKQIFLQRLQLLYNTLLEEEVRMISSSLLFIYEGDPSRWDALNDKDALVRDSFLDSDEESDDEMEQDLQKAPLSSLSLIDFAHSKIASGKGYDENVVDAIESLMGIFQELCV